MGTKACLPFAVQSGGFEYKFDIGYSEESKKNGASESYDAVVTDGTTISVLVSSADGCSDVATADAIVYQNPDAPTSIILPTTCTDLTFSVQVINPIVGKCFLIAPSPRQIQANNTPNRSKIGLFACF